MGEVECRIGVGQVVWVETVSSQLLGLGLGLGLGLVRWVELGGICLLNSSQKVVPVGFEPTR